jgi:TolB protein
MKRLTYSPGNDAHLAWSRDGKWIAFASARTGYTDEMVLHPYNGQATGEIFVMRGDGSDVRRLTENPFEDATPTWRPSNVRTPKLRNSPFRFPCGPDFRSGSKTAMAAVRMERLQYLI